MSGEISVEVQKDSDETTGSKAIKKIMERSMFKHIAFLTLVQMEEQ